MPFLSLESPLLIPTLQGLAELQELRAFRRRYFWLAAEEGQVDTIALSAEAQRGQSTQARSPSLPHSLQGCFLHLPSARAPVVLGTQ